MNVNNIYLLKCSISEVKTPSLVVVQVACRKRPADNLKATEVYQGDVKNYHHQVCLCQSVFAITSSNPTYEEGRHDKALRTSPLGANAMIDQESRSMRVQTMWHKKHSTLEICNKTFRIINIPKYDQSNTPLIY